MKLQSNINDDFYVRVDRREARRLYNNGIGILVRGCKEKMFVGANVNTPFYELKISGKWVDRSTLENLDKWTFDEYVDRYFIFHRYQAKYEYGENIGRYPAFYVERTEIE